MRVRSGEFSLTADEATLVEQGRHVLKVQIGSDAEFLLDLHPGLAATFFDGLAEGLSEFAKAGAPGRQTTAAPIYIFLVIYWQEIEMLGNLATLHQWLIERLSTNMVGDLKRIEKLCQRIGLKFKGPGRPRRGNSDA